MELPDCEHRVFYDYGSQTAGVCRWYETCYSRIAFHTACAAVLENNTCPEGWR